MQKLPKNEGVIMTYCWEVYQSPQCETCKHYIAFKEGNLDVEKYKEIVIVDDED